jgi:membrane protein YdbS with pleckstrin-like domain
VNTITQPSTGAASPAELARNMTIATPFMLLVPVAFAAGFVLFDTDLRWLAIAAGAIGWLIALALRAPVSLIALKLFGQSDRAKALVVGSSGPLEELVRLVTLVIVGRTLAEAASIGIGWAAIEVVYTVAVGFITVNLLRRDDPEARQAKEMLEAQGMLRSTGPALGVLERIGASALHIGFTLIVAWSLPAAIVTAVVHSAVTLVIVRAFMTLALAADLALLATGVAALAAGIALLA